jgi:hypothetical protein
MKAIMDNPPTTNKAITVGLDHANVDPPPLMGTFRLRVVVESIW